jgi:hypothetical protein
MQSGLHRAMWAPAAVEVELTSPFLGKLPLGSLQGDAADPTRQRLKTCGSFQLCSLGFAEPYSYDAMRWGVGVARWSASGHGASSRVPGSEAKLVTSEHF